MSIADAIFSVREIASNYKEKREQNYPHRESNASGINYALSKQSFSEAFQLPSKRIRENTKSASIHEGRSLFFAVFAYSPNPIVQVFEM